MICKQTIYLALDMETYMKYYLFKETFIFLEEGELNGEDGCSCKEI